jgi:hypothetical protein
LTALKEQKALIIQGFFHAVSSRASLLNPDALSGILDISVRLFLCNEFQRSGNLRLPAATIFRIRY